MGLGAVDGDLDGEGLGLHHPPLDSEGDERLDEPPGHELLDRNLRPNPNLELRDFRAVRCGHRRILLIKHPAAEHVNLAGRKLLWSSG